jgi:hypothetical protein
MMAMAACGWDDPAPNSLGSRAYPRADGYPVDGLTRNLEAAEWPRMRSSRDQIPSATSSSPAPTPTR